MSDGRRRRIVTKVVMEDEEEEEKWRMRCDVMLCYAMQC